MMQQRLLQLQHGLVVAEDRGRVHSTLLVGQLAPLRVTLVHVAAVLLEVALQAPVTRQLEVALVMLQQAELLVLARTAAHLPGSSGGKTAQMHGQMPVARGSRRDRRSVPRGCAASERLLRRMPEQPMSSVRDTASTTRSGHGVRVRQLPLLPRQPGGVPLLQRRRPRGDGLRLSVLARRLMQLLRRQLSRGVPQQPRRLSARGLSKRLLLQRAQLQPQSGSTL